MLLVFQDLRLPAFRDSPCREPCLASIAVTTAGVAPATLIEERTMKQLVWCLTVILVLAASCPVNAARTLRLGILPVLDTLPLQVAEREGLFKDQDLMVELVPFSSALERDTAMQSGRLDGYFGDILNTMLLIQNGIPMRMVTVSWRTTPGEPMFGLLRAPQGAPDQTNLDVGISKASIIEYLLDRMARQPAGSELSLTGVEVKQIPIRLQMLLSGQLQAALLPEPLVSLAVSKGAELLVTDENLDMPLTVICLHEYKSDLTDDFMDAYAEAVARINKNPERYRMLMVETCRVPKPLAGSFPVYRFPEPELPTEQEIWPVQQWMLTRGLLKTMLDYDKLVP